MKIQNIIFFTFWVSIPLVIILNIHLTGCSKFEIQESEKIGEEVTEDVIDQDLKEKK